MNDNFQNDMIQAKETLKNLEQRIQKAKEIYKAPVIITQQS